MLGFGFLLGAISCRPEGGFLIEYCVLLRNWGAGGERRSVRLHSCATKKCENTRVLALAHQLPKIGSLPNCAALGSLWGDAEV